MKLNAPWAANIVENKWSKISARKKLLTTYFHITDATGSIIASSSIHGGGMYSQDDRAAIAAMAAAPELIEALRGWVALEDAFGVANRVPAAARAVLAKVGA